MGFKTVDDYVESKNFAATADGNVTGFFTLRNHGDSAKVIFLYRSPKDVLVADVHYILSNDIKGYVHCTGPNCPACAKRIRKDAKIFTPLYNLETERIEFFDRNMKYWEPQLHQDVFQKFGDDPSLVIFNITRNGGVGDPNTRYVITGVNSNNLISYDEICQKFNAKFPEFYNNICREVTAEELSRALNADNSPSSAPIAPASLPDYTITPRGMSAAPSAPIAPSALPPAMDATLPDAVADDADILEDNTLPEPDFD